MFSLFDRASEVFFRAWRQTAFASAAVLFAQVRKIALARMPGDGTTDRWLARYQSRGKKQRIGPHHFFQHRLLSAFIYTGESGSFGNGAA
jgi:hypothetical protein